MLSSTTSSLRQTEVQQVECELYLLQDLVAAAVVPPHSADASLMCGLKGKTTTFTSSTFSLWLPQSTFFVIKTDPGRAQVPRTLAHLLICWRQSRDSSPGASPTMHRRCTLGDQFSKIVSAEYHILEVPNYELTTPTPAAWIEIFERRLSPREEQQLQQPYHPHIPLAHGAHLLAEAYVRDNPFSANSRASQIGASARFISVAFWACLELIRARWRCHNCASPLLWLCAAQHSIPVLCMLLPAHAGSVPDTCSSLESKTCVHGVRGRCRSSTSVLDGSTSVHFFNKAPTHFFDVIEKMGDAMFPRMSVWSRFSSRPVPQQFFRMVSRRCLVHLFRSTREDVVSVFLHVSSMSTCRIVLLRGEGFSDLSFQQAFCCVCRSVRSKPTLRGCIASTHRICDVGNCALISSFAVCFQVLCRVQGTPTEHLSSMCMCSGRHSRHTPTVEPMTAGTRRCFCHKQV